MGRRGLLETCGKTTACSALTHTCYNKEASLWNADRLLLPHKVPNHMFHALILFTCFYVLMCVPGCIHVHCVHAEAHRGQKRSWATMYVNVRNLNPASLQEPKGFFNHWDISPAPIYFYFTDKFSESLYLQHQNNVIILLNFSLDFTFQTERLYQLSNLNGPSVSNSLVIYFWLSWSSLYSQDYLEPAVILLPRILKCWDDKHEPSFLARLLVF